MSSYYPGSDTPLPKYPIRVVAYFERWSLDLDPV